MFRRVFGTANVALTTAAVSAACSAGSEPVHVVSEQVRLASKATGGFARNQSKKGHKMRAKGPRVFLDQPAKQGELLADQSALWTSHERNAPWRPWKIVPGENVKHDLTTRRLFAKSDGVVTMRKSKINPNYQWMDVEPDVQKVYRGRELRDEYERRGELSHMNKFNKFYTEELNDYEEPAWRDRVMRVAPVTERFQDPNLLTRGVVSSITPGEQYYYE